MYHHGRWPSNVVKIVVAHHIFDDMLLWNPRHELFARAISDGHSASQAYEIAGFSRDRGNAGRLRHRDDISRRVDEILATRTKAIDKTLVDAAEKAGVSIYWVIRQLRTNATMAMRHGDRSAANRAIELIGRHLNMFIEKKTIDINYLDDSDEYLAKIIALVDAETVEPAPLTIDHEPTEPDDRAHWRSGRGNRGSDRQAVGRAAEWFRFPKISVGFQAMRQHPGSNTRSTSGT
jgi:hypothetical protein